ncbi:hypothetical protein T10_2054 [Trichinella papuae]|uniref:Uncharacterized protein n=1 Tax=Trichinella papuae TaxID=268474 RepID=A0A0V1M7I1_9BILA|nr:hypothetical protein T10_2054 [Trichinella papuae]
MSVKSEEIGLAVLQTPAAVHLSLLFQSLRGRRGVGYLAAVEFVEAT